MPTRKFSRRERLWQILKEEGIRFKRLQKQDFVLGLVLEYQRPDKVTMYVGNTRLKSFKEMDGDRLYERIVEARDKLDSFPFTRKAFMKSIREGIRDAQRQGVAVSHDQSKVNVKVLHKMIKAKRGNRYTLAQFAWDFARFGKSNWVEGGFRIANQAPALVNIARGLTLTIPDFNLFGRNGPQLNSIYIMRA